MTLIEIFSVDSNLAKISLGVIRVDGERVSTSSPEAAEAWARLMRIGGDIINALKLAPMLLEGTRQTAMITES